MALNSGIILAGKHPNFMNALAQGTAAAGQANQVQRTNDMNALYHEQGPQIAAGNQGALDALARFSPEASLGIQGQRQGLEINQANLERIAQTSKIQAAKWAATQNATALANKENEMQDILISANSFYEAGDEAGLVSFLSNHGFEPGQVTLQTFPEMAAQTAGVAAAIKDANEIRAQNELDVADDPAAFRALTLRAQAAGLVEGSPEYAQFMMSGGRKDQGLRIEQKPGGGFVIAQGEGVNSAAPGNVNPSSPQAMLSSVDQALSDPALDSATGILEWTQNIPGTAQKRFGTRADQLAGQAFLQAFESLKGAGQITEIEGQKATQAIGRLDTAQSADDYRQALKELKAVLESALGRSESGPTTITNDAEYEALPSGTTFVAPDGTMRIKP